jgi:hypothetical protein
MNLDPPRALILTHQSMQVYASKHTPIFCIILDPSGDICKVILCNNYNNVVREKKFKNFF